VVKEGDVVEAKIIAIDRAKEKISLSLKRTGVNPWEEMANKYPVGSQVEGEVTHMAAFGAFIKLAPGVEGLLKTQDLSWTDKVKSPTQVLKVGDKVKLQVLEVNANDERMSLGLKQLTPDPMRTLRIGQVVKGTVSRIAEFGLFLKLEEGVDGLVRNSEIQNQKSMFSDRDSRDERPNRGAAPLLECPYKENDVVQAVVIKVNKKERKLELSIKRYDQQQEKELLKKYSGSTSNPTLGEATGWTDDDQNAG
jgi:small subunit ribosomal protein S1